MAFSAQELHDIGGLNSDGRVGFEMQVASRSDRLPAVWPEHFKGARVKSFEQGTRLARSWMLMRRYVGVARRRIRAQEARDNGGMMPVLRAETAADLHAEQLETLRQAADFQRRAEAKASAQAAGEPDRAEAPEQTDLQPRP